MVYSDVGYYGFCSGPPALSSLCDKVGRYVRLLKVSYLAFPCAVQLADP